eukprot:6191238-Pleurochrysis_carterae.AAC.3
MNASVEAPSTHSTSRKEHALRARNTASLRHRAQSRLRAPCPCRHVDEFHLLRLVVSMPFAAKLRADDASFVYRRTRLGPPAKRDTIVNLYPIRLCRRQQRRLVSRHGRAPLRCGTGARRKRRVRRGALRRLRVRLRGRERRQRGRAAGSRVGRARAW